MFQLVYHNLGGYCSGGNAYDTQCAPVMVGSGGGNCYAGGTGGAGVGAVKLVASDIIR